MKSNWIVDIERMTCTLRGTGKVYKIKYVEERNRVCCYNEKDDKWYICTDDIRDEYLKQRALMVDKILLEEEL